MIVYSLCSAFAIVIGSLYLGIKAHQSELLNPLNAIPYTFQSPKTVEPAEFSDSPTPKVESFTETPAI